MTVRKLVQNALNKRPVRLIILSTLFGGCLVLQSINIREMVYNSGSYLNSCANENLTCLNSSSWERQVLSNIEFGKSRHDSIKLLRIYDHFQTGKLWTNMLDTYDVCLTSQTSIERLYWLPQLLQNWEGPLSVSVHLTSAEEFRIFNIYTYYLQQCFPIDLDRTAIHVAFPTRSILSKNDLKLSEFLTNSFVDKLIANGTNECMDPKKLMDMLLETFPIKSLEKLAFKEVYPQNHMRNIARKGCSASWTLLTDIDIIPMQGMAKKLQEFYANLHKSGSTPCKKCAYVIPVFELNYNRPFPQSNRELKEYFELGDARQFHVKSYAPSQTPTNYTRWMEFKDKDVDIVDVAYKLSNPLPKHYEPFYVSSDEIPEHDERFLGVGFDRNSQVREASYANWTFTVLSPAYMIHWGLQSKKTEISTKKGGVGINVRAEQIAKNSILDNKILKLLELKKQLGLV